MKDRNSRPVGRIEPFKIFNRGEYAGPVRRPPSNVNGVKIGDSLPPVESNFVAWRVLVSADGFRKVGGRKCPECSDKKHLCTCEPIVTNQ